MGHLSQIDWIIVAVAIISLRFVSLGTRKHMRGVADFLSANRSAGRYLLTTATAMGGTGVVTFIGLFQVYTSSGFPPIWWQFMSIPVGAIALLTGWVFYRFRETRAMTLAQFFEMRYNKRFRVFAGILCWTAGILNFGIFPGVAARFIVYFCGLPIHYHIPGLPFAFSTFVTIMLIDLGLALWFVTMGGQITVMVTECIQGIISSFIMMGITFYVFLKIPWAKVLMALQHVQPNHSMTNPFVSSGSNYNLWFYLIGIFGGFYGWMSWQGTQGIYSSARTPHEQKMGGIIGVWREIPKNLMSLALPLAALVLLKLPEYHVEAVAINKILHDITNLSIQSEMQVPISMAHFLPVGLKGLLTVVMLYFSFTCHDTYMHSWGSIFVQDVYIPLRKKSITPEQHINILRWSIVGVGLFGFFFSWLVPPSQDIMMFFAITGAIWLGGSGAVIIGGLYWKKGATAGAYGALIVGAIVGAGGFIVKYIYSNVLHKNFPINEQWMWFFAMIASIIIYVILSLMTSKGDFNIERMLHRGKYRDDPSQIKTERKEHIFMTLLGITNEFSLGDRILAIALAVWNGLWLLLFIGATIVNFFIHPIPNIWWGKLWHFYMVIQLIISVPAIIWFAVGGVIDIKGLFKSLDNMERDHTDDGRVTHTDDDYIHDSKPKLELNKESESTLHE